MGNVIRLAVELANADGLSEPSDLARQMFDEHEVDAPGDGELGALPRLVGDALGQLVDREPPTAVHRMLDTYPPEMHLADHDGTLHLHFARNGAPAEQWLGRLIAAKLALVAAGDPSVTLGRCAAEGCPNYFVDQSRNRTRRFCGNTCASRTTVAAYRERAARG
ncbi:CGNR zinc finger domain-containing protein [Yinghuangia soli]|uniref:CGNR zinc finger domain-containing protein n=1 Tax=Yinghuangia soli TaxID=2908204 RepID=A0AA41PXT3_9ACTN|nr:CGNR zinc finger domain-containing protein [Yinghuangia soli]MCF2527330.1 CGNR zinc finger domain-containing protein [Yinghuangia soli]